MAMHGLIEHARILPHLSLIFSTWTAFSETLEHKGACEREREGGGGRGRAVRSARTCEAEC